MKSIVRVASLSAGMMAGMAIALSACGQPQATIPGGGGGPNWNPNQIMCPPPSVEMAGRCAWGADFASRCYSIGGSIVGASGGTSGGDVCRVSKDWANYLPYTGVFPVVSPAAPWSAQAYDTRIQIEVGDRVQVESEGAWGGYKQSTGSFLGIRFTKWSLDCDQIDVDGFSTDDGQPVTHLGVNAGLMISDGRKAYLVGSGSGVVGLPDVTIENNGRLLLGFNTQLFSGACVDDDLRITKLRITHCENSSGNSVSCPL